MSNPDAPAPASGRPVVLRGGTVLTMDDSHTVLAGADVLVVDDRIAAVGPGARRPRGDAGDRRLRRHRDAGDDRHPPAHVADRDARVRRRLDADPVLRLVLPRARQDVPPRGRLRRQPALRLGRARGRASPRRWTGRTGCRPSTTPRRPWTPCRRCPAGSCWPTATSRPARGSGRPTRRSTSFLERRRTGAGDLLGFQLAFDVTGDPSFPEKAAFEVARELGLPVTTHAGVWGATNDDGIRLMHENGFMTPETVYVHAATLSADSYQRIAATGGSVSVSTESEQSAGQGYPPTWQVRRHDIPVSLSMDTSVWWSGDLFSAMRTTLGADRSREHLEAHAKGETVTHVHLRAEQVVDWATRGGARALGRDDLGRLEPGREGRRGADQERPLAGVVPAAEPLRPRGLPGPAGRRAHRARRRPRGQARAPAGGGGPAGRAADRRGDRRAPEGRARRGGVGAGA